MKVRSEQFWKGYVDSQGKHHFQFPDMVIAQSHDKEFLSSLAKLIERPVQKYRTGYFVEVKKRDLFIKGKDKEYLKGMFFARGRITSEDPLKISFTGNAIEEFITLVKKLGDIDLPKPQKPSGRSDSQRIIITGSKAKNLMDFLRIN